MLILFLWPCAPTGSEAATQTVSVCAPLHPKSRPRPPMPWCRYFKPGSKAAMAAVERAKRGLEVEKQRRAAEEKQKWEREVSG